MARYHLRIDCGTGEEMRVPYTTEEEERADAEALNEPEQPVASPLITLSPNEAGDAITVAVEYVDGTVKTAALPLT